jgi:MFS family permease
LRTLLHKIYSPEVAEEKFEELMYRE